MRQDVENLADFVQYYRHSYIKSRTDPNVLHRVLGENGNGGILTRRYVSGREIGEDVIHWRDAQNSILFGLPRIGTVAFQNELSFLYYRTVRNGVRGYNPARIQMHSFNADDLVSAGLKQVGHGRGLDYPPFIHMALRHEWTPWNAAAKSLMSESPDGFAYALSFNFGAYLPMEGAPKLTYKDAVIGDIIELTKVKLKDDCASYGPIIKRWVSDSIEVA